MKKKSQLFTYLSLIFIILPQLNCGTVVSNPGDEDERKQENKPDDTLQSGKANPTRNPQPDIPPASATPPVGPAEFPNSLQDTLPTCGAVTWSIVEVAATNNTSSDSIEIALNQTQKDAKIEFAIYNSERGKISKNPFDIAPASAFFLMQLTNNSPNCYFALTVPARDAATANKKWIISW